MRPIGRPRFLNNPEISDDHVCGKCKKDNTEVSFTIQNGIASLWCTSCLKGMKVPQHERQKNIARKINEYQGLK